MNDSPDAGPLLMVSGHTLVAADRVFGRPRPRPRSPYLRLFSVPGSAAFTAGNLLARLPMGMSGVSAIIMIATMYDSYALAGAVSAAGLATGAVTAPLIARLVDRHGQARVAVPATVWSVTASMVFLLCVHHGAPAWVLFVSYAATATLPNTGGMSRARWAHIYRDDPAARHVANSFEQAADEVCFMLGPVLAAFLCTALAPEAGTLAASALTLTGMLLFTAQRRTEPPVAPHAAGPGSAPLRAPGMGGLLTVFLCTGVVFGAMEVSTIAVADAGGHRGAAGALLALQAAGSCAAGLLFGLARPRGTLPARFASCVAGMAVLMPLPLLADSLDAGLDTLALCLLAAGMATAPSMITGMALVQERVPGARLNEGMTLAVTAILAGMSAGAALTGWTAERAGPASGYAVPASAAALALLAALTVLARHRGSGARP